MTIWKTNKKGRTPTSGKYWPANKKRLSDLGADPLLTKVGKKVLRAKRTRGGGQISQLVTINTANLLIDGKYKKTAIKLVKENPANRNFARMNVITKGAIIETADGMAKVTSRPSRDGVINAILIKK